MANCCRRLYKNYKRKKYMNDKLQGKKVLCFLLSILMVRLLCPVTVGAGESTLPVTEGSDITIEITSEPNNSAEQTENTSTESGKSDGETENTSSEPENSDGTTEIISESETGDIAAVNLLAASDSGDDVSENNTTYSNTSGSVSYIITIPEQVDFGTLTQPETATDSYIFRELNVTATQLNNLTENQEVAVYIERSSYGDGRFHLTQQGGFDPFDIPYDIYNHTVDNQTVSSTDPVNRSANSFEKGYLLCDFASESEGTEQKVVLALNQKELYGKDLSEIAGSYSGTVTFHSELKEVNNE